MAPCPEATGAKTSLNPAMLNNRLADKDKFNLILTILFITEKLNQQDYRTYPKLQVTVNIRY
ncbi:hypothetical protein EV682_12233 [Iodobacter fluviatilis]|uniref:Uncharacterized protein n=1 Tax=Iodobacter fluviatilis TaxID=537 RepID=A0A377QAQ2_9NEIS|nr:hypothetical protein EV682_12233 [Iodobacter fluviatilis]STQ91962.1 Uncharacterised protein [Iodobacter fluviatilis]